VDVTDESFQGPYAFEGPAWGVGPECRRKVKLECNLVPILRSSSVL
jgi:hypothetical protein